MTTCKTCRAQIEWKKSPLGRMMPVQKVRAIFKATGDQLDPVAIEGGAPLDLYVSHFETCPDAGEHSRKGKNP